MTHEELVSLIARLSAARISECEYRTDGMAIRVSFGKALHEVIRSGETGIFHSKHPLAGNVSAREGEVVAQGQILAYVRRGTVLRPVVAPLKGRVGRQLLPDGAVARNGDPLYSFEAISVEMRGLPERHA
jgi:biotin carboxyl carrier protein